MNQTLDPPTDPHFRLIARLNQKRKMKEERDLFSTSLEIARSLKGRGSVHALAQKKCASGAGLNPVYARGSRGVCNPAAIGSRVG